jgi:hypothetical protein
MAREARSGAVPTESLGFLNRASHVRILPGAPTNLQVRRVQPKNPALIRLLESALAVDLAVLGATFELHRGSAAHQIASGSGGIAYRHPRANLEQMFG